VTADTADYTVQRLDRGHDRVAFSSGVEPLDHYLRTQASQDERRRVASVYVLVTQGSPTVIGYYTLSAAAVAYNSLPPDVTKKLPHYPVVPATLIGRLAVDQRYRGQHLGTRLLLDAFARGLQASEGIASAMIVVDAKDEAAQRFYEHYGFRLLPAQQTRLFLLMATIERTFSL